jgi:hypothetical protein
MAVQKLDARIGIQFLIELDEVKTLQSKNP